MFKILRRREGRNFLGFRFGRKYVEFTYFLFHISDVEFMLLAVC